MVLYKRFLLLIAMLTALPAYSVPVQNRGGISRNNDALSATAAVAVMAAAGYGLCKLYEWGSFNKATSQVANASGVVEKLENKYSIPGDDLDTLVKEYQDDIAGYDKKLTLISQDTARLEAICRSASAIAGDWETTYYAQELVKQAALLRERATDLLTIIGTIKRSREHNRPVICAAHMLKYEDETVPHELVIAQQRQKLQETIRAVYAQSGWPLYQAHQDIEVRKNEYTKHLRDFYPEVTYILDNDYMEAISEVISDYRKVQEEIVTYPNYISDLRYKREFDRQQEQQRVEQMRVEAELRQAQAAQYKAQAAHAQAIATQQQAAALERQNIQNLKNRLLELRIALNSTLAQLQQTPLYNRAQLEHHYALLHQEALSIRTQLYGHPGILQAFCDIFSDHV